MDYYFICNVGCFCNNTYGLYLANYQMDKKEVIMFIRNWTNLIIRKRPAGNNQGLNAMQRSGVEF